MKKWEKWLLGYCILYVLYEGTMAGANYGREAVLSALVSAIFRAALLYGIVKFIVWGIQRLRGARLRK